MVWLHAVMFPELLEYRLKFPSSHPKSGETWGSFLACQSLSFLICEMGKK